MLYLCRTCAGSVGTVPHIVLLLDVSKRNMWCGACQPVTNVIACVLSATENATMLLDNAFVNDSLISGTKEETT